MLTATAEMVPFPNEDTPLFPLSGCPARSCHYIFSLFSWCLQCSGTCQWLCLSSPGLCQHLHLKYLHTSQLLWLFCWLFYRFWCTSTRASLNYVPVSLLLCTKQLFSAIGYFWTGSPQSPFCCPFNFCSLPRLCWNCHPHFCVSQLFFPVAIFPHETHFSFSSSLSNFKGCWDTFFSMQRNVVLFCLTDRSLCRRAAKAESVPPIRFFSLDGLLFTVYFCLQCCSWFSLHILFKPTLTDSLE